MGYRRSGERLEMSFSRIKMMFAVFTLVSAAGFSLPALFTRAAISPMLYFDVPAKKIGIDSSITVKVLIDSGTALNAYNLTVTYPSRTLSFVSLDDSQSIINVWQSSDAGRENGEVHIIGGSTNPFHGTGGEIARITFRATGEGDGIFDFADVKLYAADGKGTLIKIKGSPFGISVQKNAPLIPAEERIDTSPPEINFIALEKDPLNQNQKLLSFLVKDKDSGIKETLTRYRTWFTWTSWSRVNNPAAIPLNAWTVDFRVQDNLGNLRNAIFYDWPALLQKLVFPIAFLLIGGMFFALRKRA